MNKTQLLIGVLIISTIISCRDSRDNVCQKSGVKIVEFSEQPLIKINNLKNYYSYKRKAVFVAEESYYDGRSDIFDSAKVVISRFNVESENIDSGFQWRSEYEGYIVDFDKEYFSISNQGCCDQKDITKYYSYETGKYLASATLPKFKWFDNTDVFIADVFGRGMKLQDSALFRYYVVENDRLIDSVDYKFIPDGNVCNYGRIVDNEKINDKFGKTMGLKIRVFCQDNIERIFEFSKMLPK